MYKRASTCGKLWGPLRDVPAGGRVPDLPEPFLPNPAPDRLPLALLPTALWVPSGLTAFGGSPFGTLPTGGCFRTFRNDLFLVFSFTPPAAGFITGSIASGTVVATSTAKGSLWDLGCPFETLPIGCCFRILRNYFMLLYPIYRL